MRPPRARRVLAAGVFVVSACNYEFPITLGTGEGSVDVSPAHATVAPVDPALPETCVAAGCCGATPVITDGNFNRDTCCGQVVLSITGREDLLSMQWAPGADSRLDVIDDRIGTVALSDTPLDLTVCYRLIRSRQPRCSEDSDDPTCDTGLPPDDGMLELVLSESPSVDVWFEVTP